MARHAGRLLIVATSLAAACHSTDPHVAAVRDAKSWTATATAAIDQHASHALPDRYVTSVVASAAQGLAADAETLGPDSARDDAAHVVRDIAAIVNAMSSSVAKGGTSALPSMTAALEPHRARSDAIADSIERERAEVKKIFQLALGIVTSIGGFLEVGSITTAAQGGAEFGYRLAWSIALGTICLIFLVEMSGRLAAVAKQTIVDAIRERFGFAFFVVLLAFMTLVSFLVLASELGGISLALQIATGISYRWWAVPVALLGWLLIWRGTFSSSRTARRCSVSSPWCSRSRRSSFIPTGTLPRSRSYRRALRTTPRDTGSSP